MGEFDYFYPHNSDQYAFYRIPKRLFTDRDLKTMTNGSKILYGLLLDRVDLSARNRWIDEANRIFIIYPREEICDHMGCAPKTATKLVVELEDRGLVERRIQGLGKPAVLYVKNFASRGQDLPVQRGKSYPSGGVRNTFPEGQVLPGNNTEYRDTDWNDTDLILSGEKQMRERSQLETFIREQLGYGEEFTDYFNKYDDTKSTIGEISVDELKVGAYYRVIVAYEMRHKVGEGDLTDLSLVPDWNFISKIPVPVGQFETRKCAEVYEFYLAYGENPIIVRDLLTRGQLENGSVVRDGFVIDLNGASDTVRVSQKGKSPAIASDKEVFCEQGEYHITIESKIGNQFEYDITVSDGTSLKQIAPQLYENKKNDKYTEDNLISGNGRFGAKSLSNVYIGQRGTNSFISAQVNGTDGYGVNSDRVELFMDLTGLEALANSGWTVEPDDWGEKTNQTVGSASAYLGVIGTGALVVQTSTDGINWKSIDRGKYADGLFTTDYVTNYGTEGFVHIYSPNGEDVLSGEYIRVIFAYRLKNKELKEDIRNLEIYNIYLCNSNLDAVTFNNLTLGNGIENKYGDEGEIAVAVHKSIETLRSGDETVTGFRINTQLNPAVSYEITRNGEKIAVPSDRNPEFRDAGKYEIRLTSPVGNQKRVELFVDTSSDQEALRYYFGDSFIDGKRIYSEGTYPTFEGEKSKYNISEVDSNHLPVKLQKIRLQVIPQQELYDEARLSAKCASCTIGKEDLKKDFYSRCRQCKKGIKCGKVRKCYEALSVLKHQEDDIREEYAHNIYSFLSDLKPNLLNREDKKVYSWNEVFGQSYELLDEKLKNALVAIVEQDGGRYRIAE